MAKSEYEHIRKLFGEWELSDFQYFIKQSELLKKGLVYKLKRPEENFKAKFLIDLVKIGVDSFKESTKTNLSQTRLDLIKDNKVLSYFYTKKLFILPEREEIIKFDIYLEDRLVESVYFKFQSGELVTPSNHITIQKFDKVIITSISKTREEFCKMFEENRDLNPFVLSINDVFFAMIDDLYQVIISKDVYSESELLVKKSKVKYLLKERFEFFGVNTNILDEVFDLIDLNKPKVEINRFFVNKKVTSNPVEFKYQDYRYAYILLNSMSNQISVKEAFAEAEEEYLNYIKESDEMLAKLAQMVIDE